MTNNGELKSKARASPKPAEVRAEIEKAREQISESALELRQEMAAATDWRQWVQRRPALFLTGAFALGVLLGTRRRS